MRVLVTGGNGFAGQHLLRELLEAGYEELGATALGPVPVTTGADGLPDVEWLEMDVTDSASVAAAVAAYDPGLVFHLAGQASVGRSFVAPLETWDINATGTTRVLAAMARLKSARRRFMLVSSAEVYGLVAEKDQPITEDAPLQPVTPYGASKAAAEIAALQESRSSGIEVVIARSFNHIGPGQDERFLVPNVARQLARIQRGEHEPVVRAGNLMVDRDFLDVRDAARAYVCLMRRGENCGIYNVCSGVARSLHDVIRRMIELSQLGISLKMDPDRVRVVDIPTLRGDGARIRRLGWTPRIELDQTLGDLLAEAFASG